MHKLRASFTLLNLWESGQWQEAIEMYFRLERMTTKAMADGKQFHAEWKDETDKTKCLPKVFGGEALKDPKTEYEIVVPMDDWLDLKVIIDCLDAPVIHEYKSGSGSPESYANSRQPGIYALACIYKKIYVDRAVIHSFNQHKNEVGNSTVWLTDILVDDAQEWVTTHSSEMYSYFVDNGLFERFAGRRDV